MVPFVFIDGIDSDSMVFEWLFHGKSHLKWMVTGGAPILGNHHLIDLNDGLKIAIFANMNDRN